MTDDEIKVLASASGFPEMNSYGCQCLRLFAEKIVADFLERTGQYVTNDTSRKFATAQAVSAERAACATECWKIAMDPTASQQYRLGANACFDRLRARDPL